MPVSYTHLDVYKRQVIDNIKMAATMHCKDNLVSSLVRTRTMVKHERELDEKAMSILEPLSLADKADLLAKNLPYGDQRRLEPVSYTHLDVYKRQVLQSTEPELYKCKRTAHSIDDA